MKGAEGCVVADSGPLKIVAKLLQVDEDSLQVGLVNRTIEIKSEGAMTLPLKHHEAVTSAQALAKSVYGNLFDWLVMRINQPLSGGVKGSSSAAFIGKYSYFSISDSKIFVLYKSLKFIRSN